jgi:hypothetical protein
MSHVTTVSIKIKDLQALKAAIKEFGAEWIEGRKEYNWWGVSVGDTPLPEGMTKEMLGKCDHVIKLPGVNYEIGVVKMPAGHYTLAYDSYDYGRGPNRVPADGGKLLAKFGDGLKKLTQAYAVAKATIEAKAKGWIVNRQTLGNGAIKLTLSGV